MTVGVIVNPKSAKQGRRGKALAHALEGAQGVAVETLDDFADLPDILKAFAKKKIELLVLSGGDGTVQAAQTCMAESRSFKTLPRLAVLPHGTTNMTAADVGLKVTKPARVADLLTRPGYLKRATAIRTRRTVKVENLADTPPQHGMFFGTGAIYRAVVLCQRDIHGMGFKGDLAAPAITLATTLAKSLFSRSDADQDPDRIDRGYPMTITVDGQVKAAFDQLLFLVTTLDKLIMGTRPFWNQNGRGLKASAIAYPHPSILRYLLPVMYGALDRKLPEPDFMSFSADHIGLATDASVVIDGEMFEAPADGEIKISAGPAFEYLCG
ncbi:MAG: diacylglycerol kinase family protein [Hyphomicrobiales bacterium]